LADWRNTLGHYRSDCYPRGDASFCQRVIRVQHSLSEQARSVRHVPAPEDLRRSHRKDDGVRCRFMAAGIVDKCDRPFDEIGVKTYRKRKPMVAHDGECTAAVVELEAQFERFAKLDLRRLKRQKA
jgi:hypothetical protein